MKWNLIKEIVMWTLMIIMAWDMWVTPHPTMIINTCSTPLQTPNKS